MQKPNCASANNSLRINSIYNLSRLLIVGLIWVFTSVLNTSIAGGGLFKRVNNNTILLPMEQRLFDYELVDAFAGLKFDRPVVIASPPGIKDRLFIAENGGVIVELNLSDNSKSNFLDISDRTISVAPSKSQEPGLLGLAFHPSFNSNGYIYVFYTTYSETKRGNGLHDRLSRFQVFSENKHKVNPESEVVMIDQYDRSFIHNSGDLHFGPDGYLYVSLGDEGAGYDANKNSQRIDKDFFSGIIRIDVDNLPASLMPNPHPAVKGGYRIPADNPFINVPEFNGVAVDPKKVRTEFYAVGLRNPWRMSFDPANGDLYCVDTGQHKREEINLIRPGGNYGWAIREGTGKGWRQKVPGGIYNFIDPIFEYEHGSFGNGIAAGFLYRGKAFPELNGYFIFSDYFGGRTMAINYEKGETSPVIKLKWKQGIATIGINPKTEDLLLADFVTGTIFKLKADKHKNEIQIPDKLSETGLFSDLETLKPEAGVIPYSINVPFWSDNAIKRRWFSLPDTKKKIGFSKQKSWRFPAGMIWIKHFDIVLNRQEPNQLFRLETRVLVKTDTGLYGATYRWDKSQTDADLVSHAGSKTQLTIWDGEKEIQQEWIFPSQVDCLRCHMKNSGWALGFNTAQLNRDILIGENQQNIIHAMDDAGYFDRPIIEKHILPKFAALDDHLASEEYRVRTYLDVNCSFCHQPGGAARSGWDARIFSKTDHANIINGGLHESFGEEKNKVVVPGSTSRSILLKRITGRGDIKMPPIASNVPDIQAGKLIGHWINFILPKRKSFSDWQILYFGNANAHLSSAQADPDMDGAINIEEYLAQTHPLLAADRFQVNIEQNKGGYNISFHQKANRSYEVQWTTNPDDRTSWRPLDVKSNSPFYPSKGRMKKITDPDLVNIEKQRFYRVKIERP